MSKVGVVIGREFLSTVKRRSYLIVTLGMPFFVGTYVALVGLLPAYFMSQAGRSQKPIGVVDLAGVIRLEEARVIGQEGSEAGKAARAIADRLAPATAQGRGVSALLDEIDSPVEFVPIASKEEALARLREGTLERVYLLPADYVEKGAIETYQSDGQVFGLGKARIERVFARLLRRSLSAGRLPDEVRARLDRPIDDEASSSFLVRPDGAVEPLEDAARVARMAVPGVFAILLVMSLLTSASYLLQGVVEEKENRVIEIILSSVPPRDLLFGKLLGLGAAGLLQLFVWVSVASFATSLLAAAAMAILDWKLFLSCFLFFVGGFLMVGSLMTGTGALGTNSREAQQYSAVWTLCLVLPPAMTWMLILDDPNTWMARALGWFPLTGPLTMMVRLGTGKVAAWDALVALLCLAAGVYLAIRASAALFRLGLLMYGKRPTLSEIARQLRHA
ncbi:MAG: ABC transporter permease [Acidobacteria bacterium]|nr:ABC transporter permease [Acidobacteriota bacterium]